MSDGRESLPEVRVGDRERNLVDAHLRQALDDGVLTLAEYDERSGRCWAARTRPDLEPLTRDLPAFRAVAPPPVAHRPRPSRAGITAGIAVVAAAAGVISLGSAVAGAEDGFAAFGHRVVTVPSGQSHVDVGVAFGSVAVVVPADARVRLDGAVVFGSASCETACSGAGSDVVVHVTGGFGSVSVEREGADSGAPPE